MEDQGDVQNQPVEAQTVVNPQPVANPLQNNTQEQLQQTPTNMQKSGKGRLLLVLFIILILILGIVLIAYFVFNSKTNTQTISTPVNTVKNTTGGYDVKELSLNQVCSGVPTKGFEVQLTKAYLLPNFADLPDYKVTQVKLNNSSASALLIIEAKVTNTLSSGELPGIYGEYILRRSDLAKNAEPLIYGQPTIVNPKESKTIYTYFPISKSEKDFKLNYCDLVKNQQNLDLNFTTSDTQNVMGTYKIDSGFTPSN